MVLSSGFQLHFMIKPELTQHAGVLLRQLLELLTLHELSL